MSSHSAYCAFNSSKPGPRASATISPVQVLQAAGRLVVDAFDPAQSLLHLFAQRRLRSLKCLLLFLRKLLELLLSGSLAVDQRCKEQALWVSRR